MTLTNGQTIVLLVLLLLAGAMGWILRMIYDWVQYRTYDYMKHQKSKMFTFQKKEKEETK